MTRNGNTTHHLSEQEVALCAEAIMDQQPERIPAELKLHLAECNQCATEVAMVADISEMEVQEAGVAQTSDGNLQWIAPLLAAAILLGFVLWIFYPSSERRNGEDTLRTAEQHINDMDLPDMQEEGHADTMGEQAAKVSNPEKGPSNAETSDTIEPEEAVETDKEPKEERQQTLLASYTPDPNMEMLVENYQSAYRGGEIEVKSPSVVLTAEHTQLSWNNPGENNLLLEITDNEGNEVFSSSTRSSSVEIPRLSPGLYYWKLIEEEDYDLLFVGKIRSEEK